jgi:hypothetical protein
MCKVATYIPWFGSEKSSGCVGNVTFLTGDQSATRGGGKRHMSRVEPDTH